MKLFFISVLSVSHRVQIWEETKQGLATDWAVLQPLRARQNLATCSSRDRAGEETREARGSQDHAHKQSNGRVLCLALCPVSTPAKARRGAERVKRIQCGVRIQLVAVGWRQCGIDVCVWPRQ